MNFDLIHSEDDFFHIFLRIIAGFMGCYLLLLCIRLNSDILQKCKLPEIGKKTMELYVVHMYVNNLFINHMTESFFSVEGILLFCFSLLLTVMLTCIIIKLLETSNFTKIVFLGKMSK